MALPANRTPKTWVYDFEVYHNLTMVTFLHIKSGEKRKFIIFADPQASAMDRSRNMNDLQELVTFVLNEVIRLIGYNNHRYDDMILKHLMINVKMFANETPDRIAASCKVLSDKIINHQNNDQRKRDEYLDNLNSRVLFESIDLMQSFNTINRVSLKQIAINLKHPEIIDLPFDPSYIVMAEDVDKMGYYNLNDCIITKSLLFKRTEELQFRQELGQMMKLNFMSVSDTGIAKTILRRFYCEVAGVKFETFKDKRTFYKNIALTSCIGKRIHFYSADYMRIVSKVRNTVINPNFKSTKKNEKQFEYIHKSKYLTHTVGLGGIHSNNPPEILEETEEYEYLDVDVTSYYPNILIEERLCPKHLDPDAFIEVYEDRIKNERVRAKVAGEKVKAESLKKTANGTFGMTKNKYIWLYDPYVTTSICVRGELFLLMLMEQVEMRTNAIVVYSNTDGLTFKVPRSERKAVIDICKQWEAYTKFELEYVNFRKMIIKDVNNYMMITNDPKKPIKAKGRFLTEPPITSGFNYPVISKALYEFFINGRNPEDYIKKEKDPYEFMRAERTSALKYDILFTYLSNPDVQHKMQKTNRWIVTKGHPQEGKLVKHSLIRNTDQQLQKGFMVTITNDMKEMGTDIRDFKVDYMFYIKETWNIIKKMKQGKKDTHHALYTQNKMF